MQMRADHHLAGPGYQISEPEAPLIAHVLFSFKIGGLENGVVNLINHLPPDKYRHAVICITDYSDFRNRIRTPGVECIAMHKPPGHHLSFYVALWRVFRKLRPAIVHTRNLAALECMVPAALAGVPIRIHSEHGRDVGDLDGSNRKYQLMRRALTPFVHQFVALSKDLECYLRDRVRVPSTRLLQLYNGVDTSSFAPARNGREPLP